MTFIAATIFVLGVLIFVHELGHFLAAKSVGIGVPRFSIGFGPPTPLRFRRGETEYLISWLPLGGYVKMASREEQEMMAGLEGGSTTETFPPEKLFENKPLWARILTISAGVIMNMLFAWAVYTGVALTYGRPEDPPAILQRVVEEALPEEAVALSAVPSGTRILRVNEAEVATWGDVLDEMFNPSADRLQFQFEGGVEPVNIDLAGKDAEFRGAISGALVPWLPASIREVVPGSPAAQAGLASEDRIVAVDGVEIGSWEELVRAIEPNAGQQVSVVIARGEERFEVDLVPEEATIEDPSTGEERKVGRIGISQLRRLGVMDSIKHGVTRTWDSAELVLGALKGLVTFNISPRELGGPIAIGQISGEAARQGFRTLLAWMALLSVNLAILNLLPIPVLDGGHLVFLFLEGIRGGRPLTLQMRQRLMTAGLYIVLLIMVWALGNDFLRVLGW